MMVEDTDFNVRLPGTPAPQAVTIKKTLRPGENVHRRGDDLRAGDKALSNGNRLRAIVTEEDGRLVARLSGRQGSGNILSLVQANALLIVPSEVKSLPANSDAEI